MSGWNGQNPWLRNRKGAGLTEYVIILHMAVFVVVGLVGLFGDNIRALFASADNSLTGVDSTPATRPWVPKEPSQAQLGAMQAALHDILPAGEVSKSDWGRGLAMRDPSQHPLDAKGEATGLYAGYETEKTTGGLGILFAFIIFGTIIALGMQNRRRGVPTAGWRPNR
jgi:hypothetical protein